MTDAASALRTAPEAPVLNSTIRAQLAHRTIRSYTDEPVSPEVMETLLEVARHSATSSFQQQVTIIRVTDPALREELREVSGQPYVGGTIGELLVFVVDLHRNAVLRERAGASLEPLERTTLFLQGVEDVVIAAQNVVVAAESLGLGTTYLGSIGTDPRRVIAALGLPERTYPLLGLLVGHPGQEPRIWRRTRRRSRSMTTPSSSTTTCATPAAAWTPSPPRSRVPWARAGPRPFRWRRSSTSSGSASTRPGGASMTVSTTHDGRSLPALEAFDFPVGLVLTGDGQVLAEAGETDEVFPFASVTKPIVAWSALVAVDRGLLSLDDPATPASSGDGGGAGGSDDGGARAGHQVALPGATMRHLLSHSSGIAFDSDAVLAPPARRRVYSNRGIEILGERLVEATGTPLEEWVETTVLEPLGMASVSMPGSPAYSGQGSAGDLSLFARELAAPTLVSPSLARQACDVVLPELDGVLPGYGRQSPNDFGLGVEIRGSKHPHWTGAGNSPQTFGHFGQAGSFIWVDPVAGRQAVFLGARPFGRTHVEAWPALSDQLLAL